jgi:hypothetical protein
MSPSRVAALIEANGSVKWNTHQEDSNMNIKLISLTLLFVATGALAAGTHENAELSSVPAGLDIQNVVSVTPVPGSCQVEPATMIYIDSHGITHRVTYNVMGTCQGGI